MFERLLENSSWECSIINVGSSKFAVFTTPRYLTRIRPKIVKSLSSNLFSVAVGDEVIKTDLETITEAKLYLRKFLNLSVVTSKHIDADEIISNEVIV